MSYFTPQGGLPAQTELLTDRAIVTEAYTGIPKGVLRDIVTSNLPGFTRGAVVELNRKDWALRAGYFQVPKEPNNDVLDPRLKRIGNPREGAPALARDRARPGGKGIGRGFNCSRNVLGAPSGDLGDRAPVRRILDLEHLA